MSWLWGTRLGISAPGVKLAVESIGAVRIDVRPQKIQKKHKICKNIQKYTKIYKNKQKYTKYTKLYKNTQNMQHVCM